MATGLRVATALCRTAVTGLAAAALACSIRAPDVSFVALVFLKVALVLDLFWHLPRLVYDGAHLFFQVPLPAHGLLFSVLVVVEWAAMVVLLAAVSSTTGVLVFFQVDTRACLPPTSVHSVACSYWHGVSATLTLCAWWLSAVLFCLVFFLLRFSPVPHH